MLTSNVTLRVYIYPTLVTSNLEYQVQKVCILNYSNLKYQFIPGNRIRFFIFHKVSYEFLSVCDIANIRYPFCLQPIYYARE